MKKTTIQEGTFRAHDLDFHVIMEQQCTEVEFRAFCTGLEGTIGSWDIEEAKELHQSKDGYFTIDHKDGSCHMVEYDARGGHLHIKGVMSLGNPCRGNRAYTI
jgi:hypothetical protein